ncbi:unnamed protein product, partial [Tenebrio molitor]
IFKNSTRTNLRFYVICGTTAVLGVLFCPFCGSDKEWNLAEIIFDEYLSPWSLLFYHIFYWSLPLLIYNTIRPCLILLYTTARMRLQVSLINQRILQDCVDNVDFDKLKVGQQISYQNKIFRTLCSCIDHHVLTIRMFKKLLATVKLPMVILLLLSVLVSIFVIFVTLYTFEDVSTIWKLCLIAMNIFVTMITFTIAQAGQNLFDETSNTLDILTQCSWYNWDAKNKQILLIFMANCLKPCSLAFAGIVVDYNLTLLVSIIIYYVLLQVLRNACSYALVLYNLQNRK